MGSTLPPTSARRSSPRRAGPLSAPSPGKYGGRHGDARAGAVLRGATFRDVDVDECFVEDHSGPPCSLPDAAGCNCNAVFADSFMTSPAARSASIAAILGADGVASIAGSRRPPWSRRGRRRPRPPRADRPPRGDGIAARRGTGTPRTRRPATGSAHLGLLLGDLAADRRDLPLQVAHPRFARVAVDDRRSAARRMPPGRRGDAAALQQLRPRNRSAIFTFSCVEVARTGGWSPCGR